MDKQKQIEEMAKVLHDGNAHRYADWVEYTNADLALALKLYNAGYRKIPENAVVIEKSEYEKLRLLADECIDWRRKNCNVGELPKENAVVLTQEEYDGKEIVVEMSGGHKLKLPVGKFGEMSKILEKYTRKETVEKFAERAKESAEIKALAIVMGGKLYPIYKAIVNKIDEICKEITEG